MDKKYLIIAGAGLVAIALYYLISKNKNKGTESIEEIADSAASMSAEKLSSLYTANKAAPDTSNYSAKDRDYNDAVRRYQEKYGTQPDSSWDTDEIEARIASYDETQKYIKMYLTLERQYDEGNVEKTDKELSRMNVDDLKKLVTDIELQNKRTYWSQRKAAIAAEVDSFIDGSKNGGTWSSDAKQLPIGNIRALAAMEDNEKVYAASYFMSKKEKIPTGTTWANYTKGGSFASSIDTVYPSSNCSYLRDRAWKNIANFKERDAMVNEVIAFNKAFRAISGKKVNEYGEII